MADRKVCPVCRGPVPRPCLMYCSLECYGRSRRRRVTVACGACGAPFELRPYEAERAARHYCGSCKAIWTERSQPTRTPTGYTLDCFTCGTPVYRPMWRSRRYVYTFCGPECRRAGWRNLRLAWEALKWGKRETAQ